MGCSTTIVEKGEEAVNESSFIIIRERILTCTHRRVNRQPYTGRKLTKNDGRETEGDANVPHCHGVYPASQVNLKPRKVTDRSKPDRKRYLRKEGTDRKRKWGGPRSSLTPVS